MVINPNQVPFVILTKGDNKLYYSPKHIYEMHNTKFLNLKFYLSKEDVIINDNVDELEEQLICYKLFYFLSSENKNKGNDLFFNKYNKSGYNVFYEFGNKQHPSHDGIDTIYDYSSLLVNNHMEIKSDRIDIVDNSLPDEYRLITSLTLTGLKKKNNDERDFVGDIACYMDNLIKVDRTSPNNPTVQLLSFNDSQYKDDYEMEKRIKLYIYIGEYL